MWCVLCAIRDVECFVKMYEFFIVWYFIVYRLMNVLKKVTGTLRVSNAHYVSGVSIVTLCVMCNNICDFRFEYIYLENMEGP